MDNFSLGEQFEQNPFAQFVQGGQGGGQPQGQPMPQGGGMPAGLAGGQGGQAPVTGGPQEGAGASPASGMDPAELQRMQAMQDPKQNPLLPGANPGGSKFLVGAIQQLQGYIAEETDRDEIAIGRSIIQLLTRLIAKDQDKQNQKLATIASAQESPTSGGGAPQAGPTEPGY